MDHIGPEPHLVYHAYTGTSTEETSHSRQIEKWPYEMEKLGREGEYAEVWLVGDRWTR